MRRPWGDEVSAASFAGHPGLLYARRPRTFAELLTGVQRWSSRTFLVQGDRRITFGEFFAAIPLHGNGCGRSILDPGIG